METKEEQLATLVRMFGIKVLMTRDGRLLEMPPIAHFLAPPEDDQPEVKSTATPRFP